MNTMPGRLVLIGHPVAHSLSPAFQNAALEEEDFALRYEAIDVNPGELRSTLTSLRASNAAGNVTVPHKEAVFAACDELTAEARRVGAVNSFMMRGSVMVGHNTDVEGVRVATRALLGTDPKNIVVGVIGAGGAAAAVLSAVEGWDGCRALATNRGADRLGALVARFGSVARPSDAAEIAREADIVINATSLGLREADALAIDPHRLRSDCAVLDLVYSRNETALVSEARKSGRRAADGLGMLIAQGAAAFAWWFGIAPNLDLMWMAVGRPRPQSR
jgi:shikimate dehydrogenase